MYHKLTILQFTCLQSLNSYYYTLFRNANIFFAQVIEPILKIELSQYAYTKLHTNIRFSHHLQVNGRNALLLLLLTRRLHRIVNETTQQWDLAVRDDVQYLFLICTISVNTISSIQNIFSSSMYAFFIMRVMNHNFWSYSYVHMSFKLTLFDRNCALMMGHLLLFKTSYHERCR